MSYTHEIVTTYRPPRTALQRLLRRRPPLQRITVVIVADDEDDVVRATFIAMAVVEQAIPGAREITCHPRPIPPRDNAM
ncbi:hypothetical protein ABTX35_01540 [Streptomyces sp. NPDC096080]|uniref:hypothetical protein n=1 Tax=Streptomyces sp. NPDC096080 TaxID=3156693 RepID=UPI0033261937